MPSDFDWHTLVLFSDPAVILVFDGCKNADSELKETTPWIDPNHNVPVTNLSRFTGLPAGVKYTSGTFGGAH